MTKPKLKNLQPSTRAIFDILFEKLMMLATSNGQLIERNKTLMAENERLKRLSNDTATKSEGIKAN